MFERKMSLLIRGVVLCAMLWAGQKPAMAQDVVVIIRVHPEPHATDLFSDPLGKLLSGIATREARIQKRVRLLGSLVAQGANCTEIDAIAAKISSELSDVGREVYASVSANFRIKRDIAYGIAGYRVGLERLRQEAESKDCSRS